ncbi:Rne/Rng family ribonuclease [Dehalobacterium formicoaceticum]|uniref:Ribonuclease G n=1 Tax=Dehalobacterium formicoaceticum TaxID=51515 RepID=A0ABT1Y2C0_9FIRM|nr:Rne/Rng family ribonuclease [Dehalobacterium formicoaceticum]MCR6544994.1 Rne/Rng family ribonuclease [Dehalobacterium formicoaceticum]
MYKEILIKIEPEETAVAVVEDHQLAEIYIERTNNQRIAGNIYKGLVENVLPGMQAAFVDIGLEKNSFLYVEDAVPQHNGDDEGDEKHSQYSIGEVVKGGQEILVQIVKEPVGTKGARVTTHLTLPGRYLVLMPTVDYIGISRRIVSEGERKRLKALAEEVKPEGMGLIVRTVAEGMSQDELNSDVTMLVNLWEKIQNKALRSNAPQLIHKDLELLQRIVRDTLTDDVDRVLVNSQEDYEKILEILDLTVPMMKNRVMIKGEKDIYSTYDIPAQMAKAMKRKVWLKSGGYLVVDQMEALTAIDVNTGKYVGTTNLSDTVLKTNLEATIEIVRQLRVRNIGGIIIIDFIDMEIPQHKALVIEALENEIKKDKTKTNILGFTQLGLLEMTRKKSGQGLIHVLQKDCPFCEGKGKVLSEESVSLDAKREIIALCENSGAPAILVEANPSVAACLIGTGGHNLKILEQRAGKSVVIKGVPGMRMEETMIRPAYDPDEAAKKVIPVQVGQRLFLKVEEPHAGHQGDGIARIEGFVIDIEEGGALLGQEVLVEISKIHRTFANAFIVSAP